MDDAVAILPMSSGDLEAVAVLETENRGGWNFRQLASQLEQEGGWQYVARRSADRKLVGYICGRSVTPETEIFRVAVDEHCRRQGVGRLLLAHALQQLRQAGIGQCYLECRKSNEAARMLYAAAGFAEIGRRKNYYRDPREDAILLSFLF